MIKLIARVYYEIVLFRRFRRMSHDEIKRRLAYRQGSVGWGSSLNELNAIAGV